MVHLKIPIIMFYVGTKITWGFCWAGPIPPPRFFLEENLGFSFGKFFSTVSQVVLPCPGLKKTKLGNSDPLSEEFEPWVTWRKLTWGELTHLRRRTMKSLVTIPNTQILTIPDIPTLTFKFPWFSEISSSNSAHKKHTERILKIKWWRSILEKQILWVWGSFPGLCISFHKHS